MSIELLTIKLSGGERECCNVAQRILYCKIRCRAADTPRNMAICTTRSTMCNKYNSDMGGKQSF